MAGQLSPRALLDRFHADQHNFELVSEVNSRLFDRNQWEEMLAAIREKHAIHQLKGSEPAAATVKTWNNCISSQTCHPYDIRYPQSCEDLIAAVNDAKEKGLRVRTAGAGHSFSDICLTDGIMLDFLGPTEHRYPMSKVLDLDPNTLKEPSSAGGLLAVESGIQLAALNDALFKRGKALATLGAYDGQTIAGAISTGTHGSMIKQGPIASLVRALVLVSESGTVYQIEPSDGITNPATFKPGPLNMVLKQDDDWFNATLVSMGCMGIIYSYVLEVDSAFLLEETRAVGTWQDFKQNITTQMNQHDYFEVDINPYAIDGTNLAVQITRDIRDPSESKPRGSRGLANWLAGLVAECGSLSALLVDILNAFPTLSPGIISRAMETLKDANYVDWSYKVFNLGPADDVKAYALELSFDATADPAGTVDKVIAAFDQGRQRDWYIAGPIAVRFVNAASAFVAPQQGRFTMMVELDMLAGIETGNELLTYVKDTLYRDPAIKGLRIHWGLDLDTVTKEEIPGMFPKWGEWLDVYDQLNTSGMFNNQTTKRLGIDRTASQS